MIVDRHISLWRLLPIIWKRLAVMALVSALIVVPMDLLGLERFAIGMTTPLILGTALAIFLGFRTNSAYERWMEGRQAFGQLGAQVQNLALVLARTDEPYTNLETGKASRKAKTVMTRMIRRAVAFLHVFGRELKDDPDPAGFDTADDLLEANELAALKGHPHPSLYLQYRQSRDFREAAAEGQFLDGEHFEYVAIQREIASLMVRCEALKNTPFPTHYTFFTNVFIWLLVVLLSLSLPANEVASVYVIPMVVLIGWIFTMIEGIGDYMDYPWLANRNAVPVRFLARQREREIRTLALGEDHGLKRVQPEDGALY